MISKLSNSQSYNDFEDENLQLQSIHEIHPSAKKEASKKTSYDSSLFKHTTTIKEFNLLPDTPLAFDTKLKNQKRDLVLKNVHNWTTENSRPMTKTTIIFASPALLEIYSFFPNLITDQHFAVGTIKTNFRKK